MLAHGPPHLRAQVVEFDFLVPGFDRLGAADYLSHPESLRAQDVNDTSAQADRVNQDVARVDRDVDDTRPDDCGQALER